MAREACTNAVGGVLCEAQPGDRAHCKTSAAGVTGAHEGWPALRLCTASARGNCRAQATRDLHPSGAAAKLPETRVHREQQPSCQSPVSMLRVCPLEGPWLVGVRLPVWLSMVPPRVRPIMVDDKGLPGGSVPPMGSVPLILCTAAKQLSSLVGSRKLGMSCVSFG